MAISEFNKEEEFQKACDLNLRLTNHGDADDEPDYQEIWQQLTRLIQSYCSSKSSEADSKSKSKAAEENENLKRAGSSTLFKLVSRNLILVLGHLTNKIYDTANNLFPYLTLTDSGNLTAAGRAASIVLIDLFENYPHYLTSLLNFGATTTYKLMKKANNADSYLIYLLDTILKNASKADIDDKFQAKLTKIVSKNILSSVLRSGEIDQTSNNSSVKQVEYNLSCLKSLLVMQTASHYEQLLEFSASSTSGSKLKPDAIMTQQHQFQVGLLTNHKKIFHFGFSSQFPQIRAATVTLLAYLLHGFVDTGKFDALEYLLESYPLPSTTILRNTLKHRLDNEPEANSITRKEHNILSIHNSEGIIDANLSVRGIRFGYVETFMMYAQLQQVQDYTFLSSSICSTLDLILTKFKGLNLQQQVVNREWTLVLDQWAEVIKFLLKESGASIHESIAQYLLQHFSSNADAAGNEQKNADPSKLKRSDTGLFGLKSGRKIKGRLGDSQEINPFANPFQLSLLLVVVDQLVPYSVSFGGTESASDSERKSAEETLASETEDDEQAVSSKDTDFVSSLLLTLLANGSERIRNHATSSLLHYARVNESQSNSLILSLFRCVTQEFGSTSQQDNSQDERNFSDNSATRLFSYALALSSLIKQAESTMLQNSTIAKILSFCTQNLKHGNTSNKKFLTNAVSWIIMSSLVTFSETSEFVKLNSSQFLVFWKNLLTSQFINGDISNTSDTSQTHEVINNLILRSLGLVCLHNYIVSVQATAELSRQLQFLLVKSYTYLTYLESSFESIGLISSFTGQALNETDLNPNLLSNAIFANLSTWGQSGSQSKLLGLILYNKKVVLQGFIQIAPSLKRDVNSSLVVFLTRVFADAKCFSRVPLSEPTKEKAKSSKSKSNIRVVHENATLINLEDDYNYDFGITSRYKTGSASYAFASPSKEGSNSQEEYSDIGRDTDYITWLTSFENEVKEGGLFAYDKDPAVFLVKGPWGSPHEAANILTSIVDRSIELFQLVFPNLTFKIQFSLLEQLRASLTNKNVDPLRKIAIQINDSIALHGLLKNFVESNAFMDPQILDAVIDTIEKITTEDVEITSINAETIGMASTMLSRSGVEALIARYINNIVTETNPSSRGRSLLFLSYIFKFSHVGYLSVLDVLLQLLKDPNPIMATFSSVAATVLLESSLGNEQLVKDVIEQVYLNILSEDFGISLDSYLVSNLRAVYKYQALYAKIVSCSVTSLGPALRTCDQTLKSQLRNLLVSFANGIGSFDSNEYVNVMKYLLLTFQEILIFDPNFVSGFPGWFHYEAFRIIKSNMKSGIGILSPTSPFCESIFPVSSSSELYALAFASLLEMTKVGIATLSKENVNLAWISMELNPCGPLKELIKYWVESKPETTWFAQVNALFRSSARKLSGPFIEQNYQVKLLPLTQRQKKKNSANIDLKDDEVKNIVHENSDIQDKNEPISWEFRSFLYDILVQILGAAEKNPDLTSSLTDKIQEIVRMSFLGTTSQIHAINLKGVNLLDKALSLFGQLEDPLYPGISILEQQQAQIISALVPCFGSQSNSELIVNAISVSSKFINLPRIKFYSKQRILKTLICLLEEVSSNKFLKFVYLEAMSEYSKKAIQLSILSCWAVVRIDVQDSNEEENSQLIAIIAKYSELLLSLWILALKDLSTLRYAQPSSREVSLYSGCWLNFVEVLTIELEQDPTRLTKLLQDDSKDFFFVLFCQCAEALIKNQDTIRVLSSVQRLVSIPELVENLLMDDVFGEVIDLLDRLVLVEEATEAKIEVIEIVSTLSRVCQEHAKNDDNSDKLLELLRVAMLPLFSIFPFLREDFNVEDAAQQIALKRCSSASNLLILKKSLSAAIDVLKLLNGDKKANICSCLFFLFAKFYLHDDDNLIGVILPYLKLVIHELDENKKVMVHSFFDILKKQGLLGATEKRNNHVITIVLLITNSDLQLNAEDSEVLADAILDLLQDPDFASAGVHSVKSLIRQSRVPLQSLVVRNIIRKLLLILAKENQDSGIDLRLALEIAIVFTQSDSVQEDPHKVVSLYAALVPILVKHTVAGTIGQDYLHKKTVLLLNHNPEAFKTVVNEYLEDSQKEVLENLVKRRQHSTSASDLNDSTIELKTFG